MIQKWVFKCHHFNMEQYIPYLLTCDMFSRSSETYLHDALQPRNTFTYWKWNKVHNLFIWRDVFKRGLMRGPMRAENPVQNSATFHPSGCEPYNNTIFLHSIILLYINNIIHAEGFFSNKVFFVSLFFSNNIFSITW